MPRGGVANRGNQMAYLAGLHHERATHPHIGALLDVLHDSPLTRDPESPAAVNVRELRRLYHRHTRLPRRLIEELARITSLAQQDWTLAQEKADFKLVLPWLQKIIPLKREEAEALGYEDVPYDALLEEYEPGARSRELSTVFETLRRELVPLVTKITATGRQPRMDILNGEFALERQRAFGERVAAAVGFDFQGGRLDSTSHPFFSTIGPGDCRITTRYSLTNFSDSFFGILHEVGHALYEQGLDPAHHGLPLGEAASLGMHESQARLWENTVGRSLAFWEHFFPVAREFFAEALGDVRLDDFYFAINQVAPSLNRVRADAVTYNLHILIRFELEMALIAGDLEAADVPGAWDDAYQRFLNVTPSNAGEGCLQDSHWAAGLFGYFPTYTLGNLFAAQLYERACHELGDLHEPFAKGEFAVLLDWLRSKVYRQGHRYPASVLIEKITGTPPRPEGLIRSLRQKYCQLYGCT
jgi:carboxypeptidase Taq